MGMTMQFNAKIGEMQSKITSLTEIKAMYEMKITALESINHKMIDRIEQNIMEESVRYCMTFEERPPTPDDIKKYRRSANLAPGKRYVHPKLNAEDKTVLQSPVSAKLLAALLERVRDNTISNNAAKQVFESLWAGEGEVDAIIEAKGLKQESDTGAIEAIIDEVLAANPAMVEEFKAGKEKAFNALVGQCMKASKGKANPAQVNEILKKKLTS